ETRYPDHVIFHRHAANFPWVSHGVWLLQQMRRWGQLTKDIEFKAAARGVFRPDLYRIAAASLRVSAPLVDFKPEGSTKHDFIDGDLGPIAMARPHMFGAETFVPHAE
ncbi:MAG: nitrate ABC transporter substrate-binding protein, partial [Chitinophagales bacterium]|nr:nitrate ABC transporter substrate-binding protein [Hyphomicrobiales bacterium]